MIKEERRAREQPAERWREQWEDKREEEDYNDPLAAESGPTCSRDHSDRPSHTHHYTSHRNTNTHHCMH